MGMQEITAIPHTPAYVKGIINLRGKVVPVIDLLVKFGMAETEYTARTCIIVVNVPDDRCRVSTRLTGRADLWRRARRA